MMKFLKLLLYAFSGLVLLLATLITWVYLNPLTGWKLVEKYILPSDLSISWESLDFNIEKEEWRKYKLRLAIVDLHITKGEPKIVAPIDAVKLAVDIHLFEVAWWNIKQIEVLSSKDIILQASPSSEAETDTSSQNIHQQISSYVRTLAMIKPELSETFNIDLKSFLLYPLEGNAITGKASIRKISTDTLEASITVKQDILDILAQIQLIPGNVDSDQPFSTIDVTLNNDPASLHAILSPIFANDTLNVDIKVDGKYKQGPKIIKILTNGKAVLSSEHLRMNLETGVSNLPGAIRSIDKILLEAAMPLRENRMWSDEPSIFKISSSLNLLSLQPNLRTSLEKACKCKMPQLFDAEINGKVFVKNAMSNSTEIQKIIEAKIKLAPIQNPLLYANMALDLGILKEGKTWLFEPALDADIRIDSFKALQQFLDYYHVLIPSPLDALDGKIYVTAKSPLEKTETTISTKVDVKIDLSSRLQKISTRSDLVVEIQKTLKEINIHNTTFIDLIKLELPPIDPILGIPPVAQDKRFISKPTVKSEPSVKINLHNTIQTTTSGAIQLLSSFLKPHAPVTVDLKTNDAGGIYGKLKVEPLEIKYLRRKVFVEYIDLNLTGTEDPMTLNGRLRIEQADYKIFIDMLGATDAPVIQLSSEPALSQSDIISVILYGRVSDQLVSAESETAGSVNAAIADRAIGLFGLWAFASTPIQSFSYNSLTKVYTATIQLADGLTAGIGTNWEQSTNFEVRKRLSRRWVLSASWINGENQDRSERLMLQWEKRF